MSKYCRGRKMYGRLYEPPFAHQILCKNCHWTSVTSIDTGCVRDVKKGNLMSSLKKSKIGRM